MDKQNRRSLITVVGLGSGDEQQLSLGALNKLKSGKSVYLRTERHPVVQWLRQQGVSFQAFDAIYEKHDQFPAVYAEIVEQLLREALAAEEEIIYAVPGHPMVAEATVSSLLQQGAEQHVRIEVLGGESFLDTAFARLGIDPVQGFQLLDATSLDPAQVHPGLHTIITQVYDTYTASDVKLALMELYPDDFPVIAAHALGVEGQERIERVELYELDRLGSFGNQSLVWIPPTANEQVTNRRFDRLREIVRILRSPGGCPWDREQTHASIRKHLIEETYEVLETIDDDDPHAMCEELGDLLLQIMLHAQIEEEAGMFDVLDVIEELNEKLIRRHPHVFGDRQAGDAEEALENWQDIKAEEKRNRGIDVAAMSVLDGVPRGLPAFMKALEIQKRAAKTGFDWEALPDVLDKVQEELEEFREAALAAEASDADELREHAVEELGDLLFAAVNAARFLKADPEAALASANRKFTERFHYIEERLRQANMRFSDTDLQKLEQYWQEAKKNPQNR
ncbi:nucleoside triphosphate pyrophosphohydrolase [Xylanibacillus composti]|uniref:MazG family protein n=1 Tax=Xylanibacillus composti TaxID=1572762 RepID=A0A8J4H0R6_9BACL|nr:nucleoside triphosphate pyrophosphohydrolase [Xylanibacillus composti]MDT9725141.1 nucleoside triphosphate pyrophosphohydrolase [Xylanibacillus composti]GIQ67286.1 MazG family protein [Xylanibacillus composti]